MFWQDGGHVLDVFQSDEVQLYSFAYEKTYFF